MNSRHKPAITLSLAFIALAGCSHEQREGSISTVQAERDSSLSEQDISPAFDSPESCWSAMEKAQSEGNLAATLSCLTRDERVILLGKLAYQLQRLSSFNDATGNQAVELLEQNGLADVDIMGALQIADSPGGVGTRQVFEAVGQRIGDQRAFAAGASDLLASLAGHAETIRSGDAIPPLSNITTNGETASAEVVMPGSSEPQTVYFVKEDGSWRMSATPVRSTP